MSTAERRYRELQTQARITGRNTHELLTLYVLEGFLSRVAECPQREMLVLKGGILLAALDARRPTRDIDFAGVDLNNDVEYVLELCREIASNFQDDGVVFDVASASAITIREEHEYNGVRVTMLAGIHSAQIPFHIDVNVGDPIVPGAEMVRIPRMLNSSNCIILLGYPIAMVLAEKLVTAIQRGTTNTRWRDLGDIYELSRRHPISLNELKTSVNVVAQHRVVPLTTLREGLSGFAGIGQMKYEKWRRKQDLLNLPKYFGDLLEAIYIFSDPLIDGSAGANAFWDPFTFVWR